MKSHDYTDYFPNNLKRGYIAPFDCNRVIKSTSTEDYIIRCTDKTADSRWLGFAYYYSHLALRIIPRLPFVDGVDLSRIEQDGSMAVRVNNIAKCGWLESFKGIYTRDELLIGERLIFKSYKFCKGSSDCFGLMEVLRRYCIEVVQIPEVQLKNYFEKGVMWDKSSELDALYSIQRLFSAEAFKEIAPTDQLSFAKYLTDYTKNVKHEEKLLAIRDQAQFLVEENGEGYRFLVDACNEVLL